MTINGREYFMDIHLEDAVLGPEMNRIHFDTIERSIDIAKSNKFREKPFKILTLFINKTKPEVLTIGQHLGVPFKKTWSCTATHDNTHCGKCAACHSRKREFEKYGINDPTIYLH
ncbi:7-cyano-7-deazaguanine synthase [Bacillus safensis]|uniref:7-cyano-7-deazaguanine synthase n=1 Tax=Bacillus safensis TaxID=561879 RepID=UPI0037F6532B